MTSATLSAVARRAADRARVQPGGARDAALARHPPPAELAHLTSRIGPAATLALVEAFRGRRVSVPHRATPGSVLARAIGIDAARALTEWRAGEQIQVPLARTWLVRIYHAEGATYARIAQRLGITIQTVHRNLQAAHLTAPQQDLFERT